MRAAYVSRYHLNSKPLTQVQSLAYWNNQRFMNRDCMAYRKANSHVETRGPKIRTVKLRLEYKCFGEDPDWNKYQARISITSNLMITSAWLPSTESELSRVQVSMILIQHPVWTLPTKSTAFVACTITWSLIGKNVWHREVFIASDGLQVSTST